MSYVEETFQYEPNSLKFTLSRMSEWNNKEIAVDCRFALVPYQR